MAAPVCLTPLLYPIRGSLLVQDTCHSKEKVGMDASRPLPSPWATFHGWILAQSEEKVGTDASTSPTPHDIGFMVRFSALDPPDGLTRARPKGALALLPTAVRWLPPGPLGGVGLPLTLQAPITRLGISLASASLTRLTLLHPYQLVKHTFDAEKVLFILSTSLALHARAAFDPIAHRLVL